VWWAGLRPADDQIAGVDEPRPQSLSRSTIERFVRPPGIAILGWSDSRTPAAQLLQTELQRAQQIHPDVRFGRLDVVQEPDAAHDWHIYSAPGLMGFRDGFFVFRHIGLLNGPGFAALISAIDALDMEKIRRGLDGESTRIEIAVRIARAEGWGAEDAGGAVPGGRPV
jgi:thioredoxin 1